MHNLKTAVSALLLALALMVPGAAVAYAAEPGWGPGTLVVFPGRETARVDNNGATVTFDRGSAQPWGSTITVGQAADLGAVKATRR